MRVSHNPTRRNVIKASAAALGLAGTGLGALALTTDPATAAEITAEDISVADHTVQNDGGTIESLWLRAEGSWSYQADSSNVEPDGYRLDLAVAPDAAELNFDRIARTEDAVFGYDDSAEFSILGEVTSHAGIDAADFAAPDPETTTHTKVHVRLTFAVLSGDEVLAEAVAIDEAVVAVENTSSAVTVSLTASGGFEAQVNSTDPTPTEV